MKLLWILSIVLVLGFTVYGQSGRRVKEVRPIPPVVEPQAKDSNPTPSAQTEAPQVTAEKNQDYRCTTDGTLARILEPETPAEQILSSKLVDTRAVITSQPKPSYTTEARRYGVQGFVILRVVLLSTGKIGRIRVVRALPFGVTENSIRAACKLRFKPAIKNGEAVSQWVHVEYAFRLAESSIQRQ